VRQVAGVGYYPRSGGPMGFVHLDSAGVRHWGPGINAFQMARIFATYRRTVGARLNRNDQVMTAAASSRKSQPAPASLASSYEGVDEDAEDDAKAVLAAPKKMVIPKVKPVLEPVQPVQPVPEIAEAGPVPKPRPKPIEVLMMAAANMMIEPASAPPPRVNF